MRKSMMIVAAFAFAVTVFALSVVMTSCSTSTKTESTGALSPPTLDVITRNVQSYGGEAVQGIKVIGLHKEREGSYLVITDRNANNWGGPYQLLRLESGEWMMTRPGALFTEYVPIKK